MSEEKANFMAMIRKLDIAINTSSFGKDLQDNGNTMGDAEEMKRLVEVSLEESQDEWIESMDTN